VISREDMISKVSALLAKAEATTFGPERDAFRAKADQLMLQHAIENSELTQREGRSLKDQVIKKTVSLGEDGAWFTELLDDLVRMIARHARCQHIGHPGYKFHSMEHAVPRTLSIVGMEADVEYAEMLFISLRLQIANTLEPPYDHGQPLAANIYQMRSAGLKWERISEVCRAAKPAEGHPSPTAHRWLRMYEEECERRGELPRKRINPLTVQRNFVQGFNHEIHSRLRALKREQKAQVESSGAALVPVTNAVDEVFQEMFPNVSYGRAKGPGGKFDLASYQRGAAAGAKADLNQTRIAQRPSLN